MLDSVVSSVDILIASVGKESGEAEHTGGPEYD
jgi:hypothetical protein